VHSEKIEGYTKKNNIALQGGGQDRIKAQHDKGKLTAREREILYRWCNWWLWKCRW